MHRRVSKVICYSKHTKPSYPHIVCNSSNQIQPVYTVQHMSLSSSKFTFSHTLVYKDFSIRLCVSLVSRPQTEKVFLRKQCNVVIHHRIALLLFYVYIISSTFALASLSPIRSSEAPYNIYLSGTTNR